MVFSMSFKTICFLYLVVIKQQLCCGTLNPPEANIGDKKIANPKYNYVCKKIFMDDEVLLGFINSALCSGCTNKPYSSVIDMNTVSNNPKLKEIRFDVRCRTNTDEVVLVAIQVAKERYFGSSAAYYASRHLSEQLPNLQFSSTLTTFPPKGNDHNAKPPLSPPKIEEKRGLTKCDRTYGNIMPVHFIGILDFELFPGKRVISKYLILDNDTHEHHLKDLTFTFIELPKLKDIPTSKLKSEIDKFSYFFWFQGDDDNYKNELCEMMKNTPIIEKAAMLANKNMWGHIDYAILQQEIDDTMRVDSVVKTAFEDAEKQGIEMGIKKRNRELILKALRRNKMTDLEIINFFECDENELENIKKSL